MTTQAPPSAPPIGVETRDVTVRFGATAALDRVSLTVRPGVITGLLGRNGAGKTTLLSLVGGLRRPTSGSVLVDGEDPFENALAMADTQLVREGGDAFETEKVRTTFAWYSELREHWNADLAEQLADAFELPTRTRVDRLSRGQRSMVGAIVGLASRAPLTIFDETYLGMDAANRQTFYDALIADYAAHPRTVVISSHLISEVERMFEDVVILDGGRAVLADDADAVRALGLSLTGRAEVVTDLVAGYQVLGRTDLGPTAQIAVLVGDLTGGHVADVDRARAELTARAAEAGVSVDGLGIQDLFVHLTRTTREGKDA